MRAFVLLLVAGCATTTVCPSIREYSPEFQKRLGAEVRVLNEGSAILQAIIDYGALRDQVRACRKEKP